MKKPREILRLANGTMIYLDGDGKERWSGTFTNFILYDAEPVNPENGTQRAPEITNGSVTG